MLVCVCVFLFWWIHRHLRIPLAPLSLVHVRLAKPPESNIHLELSILAQTSNTLSKLSIAEDDPQCSRTQSVLPYAKDTLRDLRTPTLSFTSDGPHSV